MKTQGLNTNDRLGILVGTLLTFFELPIALMLASIPAIALTDGMSSPVLALTIKLGFLGTAAVMTFIQAMIVGLIATYSVGWILNKVQLRETAKAIIAKVSGRQLQLEAGQKINYGAAVGVLAALILFVVAGHTPIASLSERVQHLFPGPVVLNLGNMFNLNLSEIYGLTTGFLSVGFLFLIAGTVIGSLCSATVELAFSHRQ